MQLRDTERESNYQNIEHKSVTDILHEINDEDSTVASAVRHCIPRITLLVETLIPKCKSGGRIFYIGAGTSGRLGVVDASECPPTFGVSSDMIIGLIAGGDTAIRTAVEFAEDNTTQAWLDLCEYSIDAKDTVIGIAASGTTPYVIGGLQQCKTNNITTACIVCSNDSPIASIVDHAIVCVVGPEYITGSTRMKSGTAQKLILNMISTSLMIGLGRVQGNRMIDMQMSNHKLIERGIAMIQTTTGIAEQEAKSLLEKYGSVRKVLDYLKNANHE